MQIATSLQLLARIRDKLRWRSQKPQRRSQDPAKKHTCSWLGSKLRRCSLDIDNPQLDVPQGEELGALIYSQDPLKSPEWVPVTQEGHELESFQRDVNYRRSTSAERASAVSLGITVDVRSPLCRKFEYIPLILDTSVGGDSQMMELETARGALGKIKSAAGSLESQFTFSRAWSNVQLGDRCSADSHRSFKEPAIKPQPAPQHQDNRPRIATKWEYLLLRPNTDAWEFPSPQHHYNPRLGKNISTLKKTKHRPESLTLVKPGAVKQTHCLWSDTPLSDIIGIASSPGSVSGRTNSLGSSPPQTARTAESMFYYEWD